VSTRNAIAANPAMVSAIDDPQALMRMLDYAIEYWNTDKRGQALTILERNEEQLNLRNGFDSGDHSSPMADESALSGPAKKGFFKGVKQAVQKVGQGVKQAAKAVVKFNPVTVSARGGYLLAMKMDVNKMASRLKWGYATREQAAAKGVSEAQWKKSVDALKDVEKLFADKLQGQRDALKNAILKGKAGGLSGELGSELGEPIAAATIAAATPIIAATVAILKKSGLMNMDEEVNPAEIAKEMASNPELTEPLEQNTQGSSGDDQGSPSGKRGFMSFVKSNPVPVVLGAGLVAFGIYRMMSPGKKSKPSGGALSGPSTKTSKPSSHRRVKARAQKKLPVKSVRLL